jgi:hypothetical protein
VGRDRDPLAGSEEQEVSTVQNPVSDPFSNRARVGANEIVHQIKQGDARVVLDRWTQPGSNLSLGRFGFYIPGGDQVASPASDITWI